MLATVSCDNPRATASIAPLETAEPSSILQVDIQAWIRFRLVYGLRSDLAHVLDVASDPTARSDPYHVPLLPEELQHVSEADSSADTLLPIARRFADDVPEFAGAWLELPTVVLAFNSRVAEHRAEAAALFRDKVMVREAEFSLAQLQEFMDAVRADEDWFENSGADLVDVGIDEAGNRVQVRLGVPNASIERDARERLGDTGWLTFTYDGPGPWTGPLGDLQVTVVDRESHPAAVTCLLGSTDPRVMAEMSDFFPDGRCFYDDIPAVQWSLRIEYDVNGDSEHVIQAFVVPPGGVERATVTIGPDT